MQTWSVSLLLGDKVRLNLISPVERYFGVIKVRLYVIFDTWACWHSEMTIRG